MKGRYLWLQWLLVIFTHLAFVMGCEQSREVVRHASTCEQADCEAKNRGCEKSAGVVACTDCNAGFVNVGGSCVAALHCAELQCEASGRRCVEAQANTDGTCTDCLSGYVEQDGRCVAGS